MSTTNVRRVFDACIEAGEAYDFERPPSSVFGGTVDLPGAGEVLDVMTDSLMQTVAMVALGILGPEQVADNIRESHVFALEVGVRVGQALALGDLDLVASDLDSLDEGIPWDDVEWGGEA